jgi:hypothetical protein
VALTVSIHQPAYLPWLGYFDRIANSDLFIFLDTVQFERNSFTNRNRIKTANGPIWLTVPVRLAGHFTKTVGEIEIDETQPWRRKHLRSIEQNYHRASAFEERFEQLGAIYGGVGGGLAALCLSQLHFWLAQLGIRTAVVPASELPVTERKSDLVLALCRCVGATRYLSGPLGRSYLQEETFAAAGIEVRYQDYVHPEYPQLYGNFLPAMGIVDYWVNSRAADLFSAKR